MAIGTLISSLLLHIVNGLAVPLYAVSLGVVTSLFILMLASGKSPSGTRVSMWAISMLIVGLARPEGNMFNVVIIVMFAGTLIARGNSSGFLGPSIRLIIFYVLPGVSYLVFRYIYFGDIWPAPVFIKFSESAAFDRLATNLEITWIHVIITQLILSVAILLAMKYLIGRYILLAYVAVLMHYSLLLFFLNSQNVAMRYQYHIFYLAFLLATVALALQISNQQRRKAIATLGIMALAWIVFVGSTDNATPHVADDRYKRAKILREYRGQGLSLATSEAGILPYVSDWRTLDVLGLNDPHVGRMGISEEYWNSFSPVVVLAHVPTLMISEDRRLGVWERELIGSMHTRKDYVPVVAVEKRLFFNRSSGTSNVYLINRDFPEFEHLSASILSLEGETLAPIPAEMQIYFTGETG